MSLSEFERKQIQKIVASFVQQHRPPPHIRPNLDLSFRLKEQSVELFEIRPNPHHLKDKIEIPIAKATYVKSRSCWRVLWQRSDLKWHRYDPSPEVASVELFLDLVDRDEYGCFFG